MARVRSKYGELERTVFSSSERLCYALTGRHSDLEGTMHCDSDEAEHVT